MTTFQEANGDRTSPTGRWAFSILLAAWSAHFVVTMIDAYRMNGLVSVLMPGVLSVAVLAFGIYLVTNDGVNHRSLKMLCVGLWCLVSGIAVVWSRWHLNGALGNWLWFYGVYFAICCLSIGASIRGVFVAEARQAT